jgi:hypothetical protein
MPYFPCGRESVIDPFNRPLVCVHVRVNLPETAPRPVPRDNPRSHT